jgi:hypothetical protein
MINSMPSNDDMMLIDPMIMILDVSCSKIIRIKWMMNYKAAKPTKHNSLNCLMLTLLTFILFIIIVPDKFLQSMLKFIYKINYKYFYRL